MKFKVGDFIISNNNTITSPINRSTVRVVTGVAGDDYICPVLNGNQPYMSINYIDRHYRLVFSFNDYIDASRG